MPRPRTLATVLAITGLALVGCPEEVPVEQLGQAPAARPSSSAAPAPTQAAMPGKISFKDASDKLLCKIKPKDSGFKVYGDSDQLLGKIKVDAAAGVVKLKGADGQPLRKIKLSDGKVKIEDGAGKLLYKLKRDDQGHWKLKDPGGETLFKVKRKAEGYEVRDAGGATLAKVKPREGKLKFKSEAGEALFKLKGVENSLAGAWFAIDKLELSERAALCVFFLQAYRG